MPRLRSGRSDGMTVFLGQLPHFRRLLSPVNKIKEFHNHRSTLNERPRATAFALGVAWGCTGALLGFDALSINCAAGRAASTACAFTFSDRLSTEGVV
jgi:hypothetical protein